jgi:hypothetical protein
MTDAIATVEAALRPAAEAVCAQEQRKECWLPRVIPSREKSINARNTGYVILVSQGAVEKLSLGELACAIAHELGHSLNQSSAESAADVMAVRLTYAAGFNPQDCTSLLRKIGDGPAWLLGGFLHYPSISVRVRRVEAAIISVAR